MAPFAENGGCSNWWRSRTNLEQKLVILSTFLAVLSFCLVISLAVVNNRQKRPIPNTPPPTDATSKITDPPEPTKKTDPPEPTKKTDPPEPTKKTDPPEPTKKTDPPEPTKETDPPEPTIKTDPPPKLMARVNSSESTTKTIASTPTNSQSNESYTTLTTTDPETTTSNETEEEETIDATYL